MGIEIHIQHTHILASRPLAKAEMADSTGFYGSALKIEKSEQPTKLPGL